MRVFQAVALGVMIVGVSGAAHSAVAQPSRPAPSEPNSRANRDAPAADEQQASEAQGDPARQQQGDPERDGVLPPPEGIETADDRQRSRASDNGPIRRVGNGERYFAAFNNVSIEELIPFIVETTGKVVIPVNIDMLRNRRITLVNDEPMERQVLLDMLFTAFRLNDVGVIEKDDIIILDQLPEIPRMGDLPVLYARDDVMGRTDRGTNVIKIYSLRHADAEGIADQIREIKPDYATLTVDINSNQLVLVGDIGLAQQVQRLVNELDKTYVNARTQTFRLAHADAFEIQENILDLFEQLGDGRAQRPRQQARAGQQQRRTPQTPATATGIVGPIVEMRVTVNQVQNTVTVSAEPTIVDQIEHLINTQWDLPRPTGTAKVYTLTYTDPVRVREMLRDILGQGGGVIGRGAGGQAGRAGGGDVSAVMSGIYQIDAYEDTGRLVVLSKTTEALEFLDYLIEQIDQPTTIGLPVVVELKHANAIALAEELNVLLSESGVGDGLPRPGRGLSGQMGFGAGGQAGRAGGAGTGQGATRDAGDTAGRINFPWQARTREDRGPVSPMIGTSRIVPIVRQNALAVLAPPAKQQAMRDLIEFFDRPGRQVMISAVIAEVTTSDALSLGLRLSSEEISGRFPDYGIGGTASFEASESGIFGSLFESSILDVGFNINFFLQALSRVDAVRILQQPRIFTSDNQEAEFFDGQELSVPVGTFTDATGGLTQDFDRREVGVRLNVRPRITVEGDVDLEIILELSSVVPGTAGDRVIFDRRQTSTQVIIRDGQTIVLSGILREQESEIRRKFPILGSIPILDLLFSSRDTEISQAELVAFITPTIVERPTDNDENFNVRERRRLEELARPLKEIDPRPEQLRERIIHPDRRPIPAPPHDDTQDDAQREEFQRETFDPADLELDR